MRNFVFGQVVSSLIFMDAFKTVNVNHYFHEGPGSDVNNQTVFICMILGIVPPLRIDNTAHTVPNIKHIVNNRLFCVTSDIRSI